MKGTIELDRAIEIQLEEDEKVIRLILITFSKLWNLIIGIQTYFITIVVTYALAFRSLGPELVMWIIFCDIFYLSDFVATVIYLNSPKMKRFVHHKSRKWNMILLDLISLMPMAIAYKTYVETRNEEDVIWRILLLNRCLRIYRVYLLTNMYDLTVRDGFEYVLLMLVKFSVSIGLAMHILACIWANIPQSETCEESHLFCLAWYEVNMMFLVIHYWYGSKKLFGTNEEKVLVIVAIICGVFLVYGHFIPLTLQAFTRFSAADGKYFQKKMKLQRYLNQANIQPALQEKIIKHFKMFCYAGSKTELDGLIMNLPLALKKEIFTDLYWDIFRHSDLFKDISRNCKRSLSLCMKTEYCQEEDIIYEMGKEKTKMIYLVQGVLELMAEENKASPILSFSSGTVLGEISLCLWLLSKATIKCRTPCELQTITLQSVAHVLAAYPKDKLIFLKKVHSRIAVARITQWRKKKVGTDKIVGVDDTTQTGISEDKEDCIKWIKSQWRAVWEIHERHILIVKAIKEGFRVPAWHKEHETHSRIDAVSNYLNLVVLSDIFEEKKDVVCLKTVFPWAIDPDAEFLGYWRVFVIVIALIPSLAYPYCMGWLDHFPNSVFNISIICTLVFIVDLVLLLMSAVKTRHGILTKFTSILINCLKKPTFYMDILAALPFQLYIETLGDRNSLSSIEIGSPLMISLLKAHIFLKPRTSIGNSMVFISVVKNIFIFLLFVYWLAALFQLIGIRCMFGCEHFAWELGHNSAVFNDEDLKQQYFSFYVSFSIALSIHENLIITKDAKVLLSFAIFKLLFFFWACFFLGDFYSVYSISISNELSFKVLHDRIVKYLEVTPISSFVEKRLIKTIKFQWTYNQGDNLLTKESVIRMVPNSLRHEMRTETTFKTFKKCPLFENESNEFIFDLMKHFSFFAIPAGTTLVNYGHQCHRIHMLHNGYAQINSFLKNDVASGLGAPMLIKPGDLFPTVAAFATIPVAISVITLTDCEVLTIPLEDLLKVMITHEFFKDLVDVLHSSDYLEKLSEHKPGMITFNVQFNPPISKQLQYEKPFNRCGVFGKVLRLIFIKNLFLNKKGEIGQTLIVLHYVYMIYHLICATVEPFLFGLLIFESHIIIPIFSVLNLLLICSMYIVLHIPYYDQRGLLISHPLYTSRHFIGWTMPVYLLKNLPFYAVYRFFIKDPFEKDNAVIVFLHILQKIFCLSSLQMTFGESFSNLGTFTKTLKYLFFACIIINAYTNYEMFYRIIWIFGSPYEIVGFEVSDNDFIAQCYDIKANQVLEYYISTAHWTFSRLTTNNNLCEELNWTDKLKSLIIYIVGTIMTLLFYAWLASKSIVGDTIATVYQERMKSFIEFLMSGKTDDKLVENAIDYFEHHWSRSRGQNLNEIFKKLPFYLHEELSYPFYRPTFCKIGITKNVDEGFFKLLSKHIKIIYFNRGTVIFNKGQTVNHIFFIHKGRCFVFDWFLTIDAGSMFGDIKRSGIMENKIYALTHVVLLRIESNIFFEIMNNFYDIERQYLLKASRSENFIKSRFIPAMETRPVDSKDALNAFGLQSKDLGFEDQSYFEDPENITSQISRVKIISKKKLFMIIYPGTIAMGVYNILRMSVAFFTMIVIPNSFYYGALTTEAFIIMGALDVLWALIIIVTFRVGIEDHLKGNIITESKLIAKAFVLKYDGFFLYVLTLLPFEFIPIFVASSMEDVNAVLVGWFRVLRLLRGYYLIKFLNREIKKLKVHFALRWISIIIYLILFLNLLVVIYLNLATAKEIVNTMDPLNFGEPQMKSLLMVYEFVFDVVTSSNLGILRHDTMYQKIYFDITSIISIYVKGLIIKNILAIVHINSLARSKYKSQVTALETYLRVLLQKWVENIRFLISMRNRKNLHFFKVLTMHEISPAILKSVLDYKMNLLIMTRSENMPIFLSSTPDTLRLAIMSDLYLSHFLDSPIFRQIDPNFLKLLVTRLKRMIFFPGQKIVEKGDVDDNMYFIHKGEVYVLDQTNEEAYIEYVVNRLVAGEHFGEVQGLYHKKPHVNTYRARTLVEVLILHISEWTDLRIHYQNIYREIVRITKNLKYE